MAPRAKFTREEFAEAGLSVVRKKGFSALTAQALAEELKSSTRPIFTCFGTMDELKAEVYAAADAVYRNYEDVGLMHPIPFLGVGLQHIRFAKEDPELYRLLFLTSGTEFGGAMTSMKHLQNMIRESLMRIYKIDAKTADFYFRDLWLAVHGLATLIVTGDCPYSDDEIGQILTGFSVSICKSIKEIPGFVDGTFDRDATFRSLIGE